MSKCASQVTVQNTFGLPFVLTVQEAAKFMGVGKNTAYALVNSGDLPSVRVGRQIRICRPALCRYLGLEETA